MSLGQEKPICKIKPFVELTDRIYSVNKQQTDLIHELKVILNNLKNVPVDFINEKSPQAEREGTFYGAIEEQVSLQERQTRELKAIIETLQTLF